MRAVDHLMTLAVVDKRRIAIGGHSRNSKQALVAAAFDNRIGAVVCSRGNTGDFMPWRFAEDMYTNETIEGITGNPDWFHPRLRFFVGREHKLPLDQNLLLSLVAPRGLLVSHASMEHQGNTMGVEQSYRSVKRVYEFLGKPDNVGLYQQPGEHPSSAEDVERYFDFFDTVFGIKRHPKIEIWVHGYSYADWLVRSGERINAAHYPVRTMGDFAKKTDGAPLDEREWPDRRKQIQKRITWAMGEEPPAVPFPAGPGGTRTLTGSGWRGQLFDRPGAGYEAGSFPFGDDQEGFVYRPAKVDLEEKNPTTNWPVVIWLHPYSYSTGFSRYVYWGPLIDRGFAVVAFDQIGFGARNDYSLRFYERYPHWSLLGKMVADTRAAISAVVDNAGRYDPKRIYLQGYGLGAKVALFTAALDDRVAGVSAMSGFTPLRLDTPDKGTEGVRHYSHIHGLLPRTGAFVGQESRLPVDYDEIVAAIAPRPVQIVAPTMDRHAPVEDVRATVDAAREAFTLTGKRDALELVTPVDFNRYKSWMSQIDWISTQAGRPIIPVPAEKK
jgi:pimeloyl-ACP methyl ester carboxylesterase